MNARLKIENGLIFEDVVESSVHGCLNNMTDAEFIGLLECCVVTPMDIMLIHVDLA